MNDDQLEVEAVEPLTDESADTVAASEETHDKPTFSPEQHAAAANAYKAREAKREAEELRKELEALKKPDEAIPVVPTLPEYPEPDELEEYTRQVAANARYQEQQRLNQEQQKQAEYQANLDAQKAQAEIRQNFVANATKQGVKIEDLQTAATLVDSHGLKPEIVQEILSDKDGWAALLHLSTNKEAINELNRATLASFGRVYESVKEAGSALRPKTSSAPAPVEILSGNGIPPKSEYGDLGESYS